MSKSPYRNILITLYFGASLAAAWPAAADDAPAAAAQLTANAAQAQGQQQTDWDKVLQLGKIDVQASRNEQAERIVAGLKVIKRALVAKLSNDPAHSNDIVCRMNYAAGSHIVVHLRCATNSALSRERFERGTSMLANSLGVSPGAEEQALEHINTVAPQDRYFSTKVSGPELQKLLVLVQCDGCSNSGLVVGDD